MLAVKNVLQNVALTVKNISCRMCLQLRIFLSLNLPSCLQSRILVIYTNVIVVLLLVKNLARFTKWLDLEAELDGHTPAHDVIEILGYLAYDSVREVMFCHYAH